MSFDPWDRELRERAQREDCPIPEGFSARLGGAAGAAAGAERGPEVGKAADSGAAGGRPGPDGLHRRGGGINPAPGPVPLF